MSTVQRSDPKADTILNKMVMSRSFSRECIACIQIKLSEIMSEMRWKMPQTT